MGYALLPDGGVSAFVGREVNPDRYWDIGRGSLREQSVLDAVAGKAPDEQIFGHISSLLDIRSYRRQSARDLYEHLSGKPLPPRDGWFHMADLDQTTPHQGESLSGT